MNCGWLNRFWKLAPNSNLTRSLILNLFRIDKSMLSIGGNCKVFRPALPRAPCCAVMYCAFGFFARYPTRNGRALASPGLHVLVEGNVLLQSAVTPLPTPGVPFGLKTARSPAESPFILLSSPLCTSPHSPVSYV